MRACGHGPCPHPRVLIAIGGAGAQQKYVQGFVLGMRPGVGAHPVGS